MITEIAGSRRDLAPSNCQPNAGKSVEALCAPSRITRRTVAGCFAVTVAASERFRNMLGNTLPSP